VKVAGGFVESDRFNEGSGEKRLKRARIGFSPDLESGNLEQVGTFSTIQITF
jgi:hypothetical protein